MSYRAIGELPAVDEIWESAAGPGARFALFRLPEGFGLTVSGEGRGLFRCTQRSIGIEWTDPGAAAPHCLITYALPLWLETRGVPVLHGSAVTFGERAVAFVGPSGGGKSVLSVELLRLGCRFLADDGLALRRDAAGRWRGYQGPPVSRLWPGALEGRLGIAPHGLPRVHATVDKRKMFVDGGSRVAEPAGMPLAAVYVLERRPEADGPVTISGCGASDALVRLIEHGVAAGPAAALGASARRLELLADLVETTPVRRLRFPSSADSATRIRQAISRDLGE